MRRIAGARALRRWVIQVSAGLLFGVTVIYADGHRHLTGFSGATQVLVMEEGLLFDVLLVGYHHHEVGTHVQDTVSTDVDNTRSGRASRGRR